MDASISKTEQKKSKNVTNENRLRTQSSVQNKDKVFVNL